MRNTAWSKWNQLEKELYPGRVYCPLSLVSGSLLFKQALLQGDLEGLQDAVEKRACPYVCAPPAHVAPYTSPVLLALWLGHRDEIVDFLLEHEPRQPLRPTLIREFSVFCGEAPLSSIQRMVEFFGDELVAPAVNVTPQMTPLQALHYACFRGDVKVIRYLVKHQADWTVSATYKAVTPLHVLRVRDQGHALAVCLDVMLRDRPDVWLATDKEGRTALSHVLSEAPLQMRNYCIQQWVAPHGSSSR